MSITSNDFFKLDGVSCETYGLYCDTPPVPDMAQRRYTTFKYGNDEDGVFSDDSYGDIAVSLRCYRFPLQWAGNNDDTELYAWLQTAKKLEISRFPDKYFKVKQISSVSPRTSHDGMRIDYTIKFVCAPFKYSVENSEIIVPQDGLVTYWGTRYGKPIITGKVTANKAWLNVNGFSLTINDQPNNTVITVDSSRMLVYKQVDGQNVSIMEHTEGQLPMMPAVATSIITGTNLTNLTLIKNERWY